MSTPDSFMLICDGASGDIAAEVRMASYLSEMFTGWKRAHAASKSERWQVTATSGSTWRWGPDGRLTVREPKNTENGEPP